VSGQSAFLAGRAQMYDVLERAPRFLGRSSTAALLPEEAGREGAGEARGVSGRAGIESLCGVVASGAWLVGAASSAWEGTREGEGEGEGVFRRRTEPIMERGIWTRKEPLLVGDEGAREDGSSCPWPCLRAASAVQSMSSMVPTTARDCTCCLQN
jgi:hypothetical protein